MPGSDDIWGTALRECHQFPEIAHVEIVESDDGSNTIRDLRRLFTPPMGWPALHRRALELTTGSVLDVGCAAGRHALELQERGHHVIGLDISPGAVDVASTRGLRNVFLGSIYKFAESGGLVDTVLLLEHNLAYFGTQLERFFDVMNVITPQDGLIVADGVDIESLPATPKRAEMIRHREESKQVKLRTKHRAGTTPWSMCCFVTPEELELAATIAGWCMLHLERFDSEYLAVLSRRRSEPHEDLTISNV